VAVISVAAIFVASFGTILVLSHQGGFNSTVPPCGPAPTLSGPGIPVQPGQYRIITSISNDNSNPYGGQVSQARISVWSQSTSTFYLYIMSQTDYNALGWTSNSSGPSHSTVDAPAQSYLWGSGPVTSANHTVLVGNGTWYIVIFNPGPVEASVQVSSGSCNAP